MCKLIWRGDDLSELIPIEGLGLRESFRWTPHPVIVTIRDNRDYIRVLLYFYYTTITGIIYKCVQMDMACCS